MSNEKYFYILIKILYSSLIILVGYFFLKYAISWIMPFIISFIVATVLEKPVNFLSKKFGFPRGLSSAICTASAYLLLLTGIYFISFQAVIQIKGFLSYLPQTIDSFIARVDGYSKLVSNFVASLPVEFSNVIYKAFENVRSGFSISSSNFWGMFGHIKNVASSLPSLFLSIFVAIICTYFISSDYSNISKYVKSKMSKNTVLALSKTKSCIISNLFGWFKAQLFLILITFFELCIGFIIIRIRYGGVIAAIVALIDALPVFGIGTVLIPWALLSFLAGDYIKAVSLLIIYAVVALVRSVTEPHIVGQSIGLHPLAAMISVYLGFRFLGIFGMFIMPLVVMTVVQLSKAGYITSFFSSTDKEEQNDN